MTISNLFVCVEVTERSFELACATQRVEEAPLQLELRHNEVTLGGFVIDQCWMPTTSLYGQRNQPAINRQPIIDFWWADCGRAGTQGDRPVQETYLLANILPAARSNGSRRVFLDSHQTVPEYRSRRMGRWANELNALLRDSLTEEYTELEFQRMTGNLIGPPVYGEEAQVCYEELSGNLFGEAYDQIERDGLEAISAILARWRRLMTRIGRRSGNELQKQALDILSYECRAALHRCYSGVWTYLLELLAQQYDMSDESYIFHKLWHFDHCRESSHPEESYFHLFHGHIFGLHPACGPVLRTEVGAQLFADLLREGTVQSYHRVLHALAVAVAYYGNQHNICALLRRGESCLESHGDMVAVEEQEATRRRGRRSERLNDN